MFLAGVIIFCIAIVFITALSVNYDTSLIASVLFDFPVTLFFIASIAAVIVATGSFKTLVTAVNAIFSKKYKISAADKEKAIELFKLIRTTVIYASILCLFLAIMTLLRGMNDPDTLGPKVSVALSTIFQGCAINMILINPGISILKSRYNTEEKTMISEKQVIDKLLELCYKQGITAEQILDADEISFRQKMSN